MIVQESPNAVIFDKFLCSDSFFCINTGLTSPTKVAIDNKLFFKGQGSKELKFGQNALSSFEADLTAVRRRELRICSTAQNVCHEDIFSRSPVTQNRLEHSFGTPDESLLEKLVCGLLVRLNLYVSSLCTLPVPAYRISEYSQKKILGT